MDMRIVEESRQQTCAATQRQAFDNTIVWNQVIARNVRHFRLLKKMSQNELATKCGIFRTYLSRIETGKCNPSLLVLIALANALGIQPHALFVPVE